MNDRYSGLLNRFFTRENVGSLIRGEKSEIFEKTIRTYTDGNPQMTYGECFSIVYEKLKSEHRNEYYYKNTILNKQLLGIHSLHTTTALTEIPIGKSKADFIMINGKAVVYEIKTELDNLDKLDHQIQDYYHAFSKVFVVASEKNEKAVLAKLKGTKVGVYVLTRRGSLSVRKEAEERRDLLTKKTMFRILRKREFEHILIEYYGRLPHVSDFIYYRQCLEMFENIPTDVAYAEFIKELKGRNCVETELFAKIPYELKSLVYFWELKPKDYEQLVLVLQQRR